MALPKLDTPVFNLTLPISGDKIKYRPFLVKEEKILLVAKEADDKDNNVDAIMQVVNNCIISDHDPDNWPILDLEFAFIKMRAASVNNEVEVRYKDMDDKKSRDFLVDIGNIEIIYPEGHVNTFKIGDKYTVKLKYPTVKDLRSIAAIDMNDEDINASDMTLKIVSKSLHSVSDDTTVYDDFTEEEAMEFLGNLQQSEFEQINTFMSTMPYYEYLIEYKNDNGDDRKIRMRGIQDFFT